MDIVTQLRSEHDRVMNLFNQFAKDERPEAQRQLLVQLVQELSIHESAEESAVWPEVRSVVDAKLIDHAVHEEKQLLQVLKQICGTVEQVDLKTEITRIRKMVLEHVSTEQDQIFPLVTQKCDQATRNRLGTAYMDAKNALVDRAAKVSITMLPDILVQQKQRT
ncbi:MAG TPA: hemerythrin domain-containing protein [Stenomitos sp.]